jgi:hypothetical protein
VVRRAPRRARRQLRVWYAFAMQDAPLVAQEPRLEPAPRFLRFVTALVLGGGIALAPALLGGCGNDSPHPDARPIDAGNTSVDGPLRPPNLSRLA